MIPLILNVVSVHRGGDLMASKIFYPLQIVFLFLYIFYFYRMNLRFIRKALATVSAIAIALTAVIIPSSPVVSAAGQWYEPYVEALFDLGIVDSVGNAFRPGDYVNRAELAAMLNRTVGFAVDSSEVDDAGFADVSESDWFYVDVNALENAGVVQGTTPTTYSPARNVNRAEAAKMISLALDIPTADENVPFADVRVC